MITFEFKPEKFLNAVAYFASHCENSTKKKICKLLYYADKHHLLNYGSPITGDSYFRLPHGPIPTRGLDLLNGKADKTSRAVMEQFFEVHGWDVKVKRGMDPHIFSKSEIKSLETTCQQYGHLSADYLERLSHKEPAWIKTKPSERIDYALLFEGHPQGETLRRLVEEESGTRRLLAPYRSST